MVESIHKEKNFFKRIVIPVDGSDPSRKALTYAFFFSKKLNKPLLAIYVIDMNIYSKTIVSDEVSEQWRAVLRKEGESILHEIDQTRKDSDLCVETRLLDGDPGEKIIEQTDINDLIIMGNKGKSGLDRIFIGSVSEYVIHHSDATVMIIR